MNFKAVAGLGSFRIVHLSDQIHSTHLRLSQKWDKDIKIRVSPHVKCNYFILQIQIEDLDDNVPVFPLSSTITLNLTEGDDFNMSYSLPIAVDADTERNVDTAYHLIKPDNLPSFMRK